MEQFLRATDVPMSVRAVDGEIVVLGPDGVAVSLTVAAAVESAKLMAAAIDVAKASEVRPS
jgi:hypothetical protein